MTQTSKTRAPMLRDPNPRQITLAEFDPPFLSQLDGNNVSALKSASVFLGDYVNTFSCQSTAQEHPMTTAEESKRLTQYWQEQISVWEQSG
jgi:hypothetical protein